MLVFRAILAVAMIGMGIFIIARILPFPFAQTFTGWVLGIAFILLGTLRLRQVRAAWSTK